jgi:predicted adenylyl cyclase CyaB
VSQNVEIKARVDDLASIQDMLEGLADSSPVLLRQVDTFFRCERGRLKLRESGGQGAELIAYHREDTAGPKASDYTKVPVDDPALLKGALSATLGIRGVVSKERVVYYVGQTRVHLDIVEGLGRFLELEVELEEGQPLETGKATARELMEKLGIREGQLVEGAYIDLLE